jgi:hypothetical protein
MFELIARLRKKSILERRRIAFITALVITGVIVLMWSVWLMKGGLSARVAYPVATTTPATPATDIWTPFQRFIDALLEGVKSLKKL